MQNKINLITGETYTLRELFSGWRRIIIPDLQRDYCWGNPMRKSKDNATVSYAEGFLDTLLEQFETHPYGRLNLGLIYGYECPKNYVHLCDGQQRITTLFLLLGMLNRWSDDDRFRQYLMSDFEFMDDDHDPYLQYAIRESSLYFLSDLVYRFFSHGGAEDGETLVRVDDIYNAESGESCSWFYGEYATDPSICSMLRCLKTIEAKKSMFLRDGDAHRLDRFAEFLIDRLTFIYYDMVTRANGEETFVVINTTGEPLSATENLKPLVINYELEKSAKDLSASRVNDAEHTELFEVGGKPLRVAHAWEEIENYFWQNRRASAFDTADSGFKEFLRWVTLLHFYRVDTERFKQIARGDFDARFPYKDISMSTIVECFNAFVRLRDGYSEFYKDGKLPGQGDKLSQIELFVLLPMLAYLRRHQSEDSRQLHRLWHYLTNLTHVSNVSKAVNEVLADVVTIGDSITDIIDILGMTGISATLLTDEERFKLEILKSFKTDAERCDFEHDLWEVQDKDVDIPGQLLFQGEILAMLRWATPDGALDVNRFSADKFKYYLLQLNRLFRVGGSHKANDNTRRALLAWGYRGFPYGKSYGWADKWQHILNYDAMQFRSFIDEVAKYGTDRIIQRSSNVIAKYRSLLAYCDKKNIDTWRNSFGKSVCRSSYAKPIPVPLAVLMARLGLRVERHWQTLGDWEFGILRDGVLGIRPVNTSERGVCEIQVSAIDGGRKLRYQVKAEKWEMDMVLPLASIDTLIRRLYPAAQSRPRRCSRRGMRKPIRGRRVVRG